jgi:uncharacterized protein
VFLFSAVNFLTIPWDFILILTVLGILVPWRGAVRIRRLLNQPALATAERLSLYGSTIGFQWFIVAIVLWRAFSRKLSPQELGLTLADPLRTSLIAAGLTLLLCANQWASLRKIVELPAGQRGFLFRFTEKIMPRTPVETLVFAALACTAGLSEEFLYRGFVFAVFVRVFSNSMFPLGIAAVVSSCWFAVGHIYQGRRGVITTLVVGMLFAGIRIWSHSLVPSVAAHIGVDLIAGVYASKLLQTE